MRLTATTLAALLTSVLLFHPAFAQNHTQTPPDAIDMAPSTIRDLRKIVTPKGIEENRTVRIGGIDQFISIRGADRRNLDC